MIWRYSDGTTVELGGNVEGASVFAQDLRESMSDGVVPLGPHPGPNVDLDPGDAAHLDRWLAGMLWRYRATVKLTERPDDVPALPELEEDDDPAELPAEIHY